MNQKIHLLFAKDDGLFCKKSPLSDLSESPNKLKRSGITGLRPPPVEDSDSSQNDEGRYFPTFYESIKVDGFAIRRFKLKPARRATVQRGDWIFYQNAKGPFPLIRTEKVIPSIEACFSLMDRYKMLAHIKAHSLVVAKVAHFLARNLLTAGIDISIKKVTAGALMHDIGKTASLKSGQDHSKIGKQICIENNLYEIADIVREHIRIKNYDLNGRFSEKEIVFYSDKRVNHDRIVDLDDRLDYILNRYGKKDKDLWNAIRANFKLCREVETKLFSKLNFSADSLAYLAGGEDIRDRLLETGG